MYLRCSDIFLQKNYSEEFIVIRRSLEEKEKGNFEEAVRLLQPLADKNHEVALFYYSAISLISESNDEFEKRRIKQLSMSASQGYAPSIHELAICYDAGELVAKDNEKAAKLFELAAKKGHPHSQWIHGLDLIQGSNGVTINKRLGLDFIKKSAALKFEGALESIVDIYTHGKYGEKIDVKKAKRYQYLLLGNDILHY